MPGDICLTQRRDQKGANMVGKRLCYPGPPRLPLLLPSNLPVSTVQVAQPWLQKGLGRMECPDWQQVTSPSVVIFQGNKKAWFAQMGQDSLGECPVPSPQERRLG